MYKLGSTIGTGSQGVLREGDHDLWITIPYFLFFGWQGGTQARVGWLGWRRRDLYGNCVCFAVIFCRYFESASGEEERELPILCNASWIGIWTGHGIRIYGVRGVTAHMREEMLSTWLSC